MVQQAQAVSTQPEVAAHVRAVLVSKDPLRLITVNTANQFTASPGGHVPPPVINGAGILHFHPFIY